MSHQNVKNHRLALGFLSVLWMVGGNIVGQTQTPKPQPEGDWEGIQVVPTA